MYAYTIDRHGGSAASELEHHISVMETKPLQCLSPSIKSVSGGQGGFDTGLLALVTFTILLLCREGLNTSHLFFFVYQRAGRQG